MKTEILYFILNTFYKDYCVVHNIKQNDIGEISSAVGDSIMLSGKIYMPKINIKNAYTEPPTNILKLKSKRRGR